MFFSFHNRRVRSTGYERRPPLVRSISRYTECIDLLLRIDLFFIHIQKLLDIKMVEESSDCREEPPVSEQTKLEVFTLFFRMPGPG